MSNSREPGPIWARPEPGRRQPRFTREQLAAAALKIADDEGFDAVSMRRVASELGAGTMTLYHYVRTKEDLIALMDDAMMGEVVVDDSVFEHGWRAALTAIATSSRDAFANHPWALTTSHGDQLGPNAIRHFEQSIRATADLGLTPEQRMEIVSLVDDYAFGYALRSVEEQREADRGATSEGQTARAAAISYMQGMLATGEFPALSEWAGDDPEGRWAELEVAMARPERFERGLRAVLDGAQKLFDLPD